MKHLDLPKGPLNVLCLGAHPDDIEIGSGGTLLQLLAQRSEVRLLWVVFAAGGARRAEAIAGAEAFGNGASALKTIFHDFRDGFLPYEGAAVKRCFEELKGEAEPDLIFTHTREDLHQDHRLVNELCWNTFRDQLILEFEIPKYDGDLGRPNLYAPLERATMDAKVENLLRCFPSQSKKDWFDEELFRGLARIRGMECRAEHGYAEGFTLRKAGLALE